MLEKSWNGSNDAAYTWWELHSISFDQVDSPFLAYFAGCWIVSHGMPHEE